jgi:membrane-associated phospholipid phosphatase
MLKAAIVRFDTAVTAAIQSWPAWLHVPMIVITTIGQPVVLGVIAGAIALRAWQLSNMRVVYSLVAGVAAMGANMLIKHYVHRTRPDTLYVSNMFFKSSSFPSGHAFGAAVLCGLFGYLAFKYLPGGWHIAVPILLGIFAIAVGVSRVYLGAHYPTDVIAGWILGTAAALIIIICFRP